MNNELTEAEATGQISVATAGASARELLNSVTLQLNVVRETLKRVAPELAPGFEFFRHARLDENALSAILAEMLSPEGPHGQGAVFLRLFLETIGLNTLGQLHDVRVETESLANDKRRIDIVVWVGDFVIAIENKPWAGDQDEQLKDYAAFIRSLPGVGENWRLIYLSNHEPGEHSLPSGEREKMIEDGHFVRVDFRQVADWVDACVKEARALRVHVFLEELGKFIRQNINGELQLNENEEVKRVVLESPKNIESALALTRSMAGIKIELLRQLHDDILEQIKRTGAGLQLVWDKDALESFRRYAGFGFKLHEDQDIYLGFEFERSGLNGLSWGFRRNDESTTINSKRQEMISGAMSGHAGKSKSSLPWWAWYSELPDSCFNAEYLDWEWSPKPWVEIQSTSDHDNLAKKLVACAVKVYDVIDPALLRPPGAV